jgi:hypothetical protein
VLFRAARALEIELAFDPVPRAANALHPPEASQTNAPSPDGPDQRARP